MRIYVPIYNGTFQELPSGVHDKSLVNSLKFHLLTFTDSYISKGMGAVNEKEQENIALALMEFSCRI